MNESKFMSKISTIPVPLLPAMAGACTLANVYLSLGFPLVRHITMIMGTVLILCYLIKIAACFDTVKKEYQLVVPCSLYSGFTMLLMILGSYYFDFHQGFGKGLWFLGLIFHALHIVVFTCRNVLKGVTMETFLPCWFVTYNSILVACVVGGPMNQQRLLSVVVYYGIIIYSILISLLIYRLLRHEVKDGAYHTLAIVLAPCSLCSAGYLSVIEKPNQALAWILYICVFVSLLFVLSRIPKFFSFRFTPGFAGLTFPMAIAIVATGKMSAYLSANGAESLAGILKEVQGIQIYITTVIIGFVMYNFGRQLKRS